MNYDKNSFLAGLAVGRMLWRPPQFGAEAKDRLTFYGTQGDFTLRASAGKSWGPGVIEYATARTPWTVWDGSAVGSFGGILYLRGSGNTRISHGPVWDDTQGAPWEITGNGVICSGSVEALLDHVSSSAGLHPTMDEGCFASLFEGCTALIVGPELTAKTLTAGCYAFMFRYCTALTNAPDVDAAVMGEESCVGMFQGCTALTAAPALPAKTLDEACYNDMFLGCTSLTVPPKLPAMEMEPYCYDHMFDGCTALVSTPALPAKTLAEGCCCGMFRGCTSLVSLPALPADYLPSRCYEAMFANCTSLNMYDSSGPYAFRIPASGTGTGRPGATRDMFLHIGNHEEFTVWLNRTYYTDNKPITVDD